MNLIKKKKTFIMGKTNGTSGGRQRTHAISLSCRSECVKIIPSKCPKFNATVPRENFWGTNCKKPI